MALILPSEYIRSPETALKATCKQKAGYTDNLFKLFGILLL